MQGLEFRVWDIVFVGCGLSVSERGYTCWSLIFAAYIGLKGVELRGRLWATWG